MPDTMSTSATDDLARVYFPSNVEYVRDPDPDDVAYIIEPHPPTPRDQ